MANALIGKARRHGIGLTAPPASPGLLSMMTSPVVHWGEFYDQEESTRYLTNFAIYVFLLTKIDTCLHTTKDMLP